MREPYESLLGQFRDTLDFPGFLREYLTGEVPDWAAIANDRRVECLSTGEKVLLDFAAAFANVERHLDLENQLRVMVGLASVLGVRPR